VIGLPQKDFETFRFEVWTMSSKWDELRYVPGPGMPALPPELNRYTRATVDETIAEMKKIPFFMTELDEDDAQNEQIEALKALAYEGEPDEVAMNFKNQGNDLFKQKKYKDAAEFYTKAIEVDAGVPEIDIASYTNRAACNLHLSKCFCDDPSVPR
jgi:tetratricopeptide (TPR) repeat protein